MDITVILCTYNRCGGLGAVLDACAGLQLPRGVDWEVLIVDNNSTDQTREVVQDFGRRHPGVFRYVFEPRQGLSQARNAGIREAKGDIVAFTDDDVTFDPMWLRNLTASLEDGKWAGAGGRILPKWNCTPPSWLALQGPHASLLGVLPAFDEGPEPARLAQPPYGANMAFRREVFDRFGGFRTDLGRSAGNLMSNEDTEFGRRLMRAGEQLRYEPSAVVYHPVVESRLTQKYFLAWRFDYGRALVRERGMGTPVFGVPRPYLRMLRTVAVALPERVLHWMFAWSRQGRFVHKVSVWMTAGQISELYRFARHGFDADASQGVCGTDSQPLERPAD